MGFFQKIKGFFNFQAIEVKIASIENINFNPDGVRGTYRIRTDIPARILSVKLTAFADCHEQEIKIAFAQILPEPFEIEANGEKILPFFLPIDHLPSQLTKFNILNEAEARQEGVGFRLLLSVDIEATTALFDPTDSKSFELLPVSKP